MTCRLKQYFCKSNDRSLFSPGLTQQQAITRTSPGTGESECSVLMNNLLIKIIFGQAQKADALISESRKKLFDRAVLADQLHLCPVTSQAKQVVGIIIADILIKEIEERSQCSVELSVSRQGFQKLYRGFIDRAQSEGFAEKPGKKGISICRTCFLYKGCQPLMNKASSGRQSLRETRAHLQFA